MSKTKFELNLAGLNELMKSGPMQGISNGAAANIAASAGEGFAVEPAHPISFIAIGSVYAATPEARRASSQNNVLETAAGGARI